MPQVVSKNLGDREVPKDKSWTISNSGQKQHVTQTTWKRPLMVAIHGACASMYGFAICWQNVSEASHQLYMRSNPLVRVYGRWRFLTYNCLIMQFVAYSLCFTSHFVSRLRKPRDYFFTTFALPVGFLVCSSFWAIWFIAGREYIFPASLEQYYPPWLNHISHTVIAPINLIELITIKKQYSSTKSAISALAAYTFSYASFLLYIRWKTGRFVYPFLNHMEAIPVGAFITGMVVFGIMTYKAGKILHDFVHGIKSVKNKMSTNDTKRKN